MAKTQKKNVKDGNVMSVDIVNKSESNEINNLSITATDFTCGDVEVESKEVFTYVKLKSTTNNLSDVNIMELLALEQACALLCKRYETTAQLDFNNNAKFKEFKAYYEMIFNELETRVINACKK